MFTMEGNWKLATFLLMSVLRHSYCSTCEKCACSTISSDAVNTETSIVKDSQRVIDCRGKRLENGNTFQFDLLMFDDEKDMTYLDLAENGMFELPLDMFKNLHNLKTLDLSQNLLGEINADAFNNLVALETLDLSDNNFKELGAIVFTKIPNLSVLNLSRNNFETFDGEIANALTNLTSLDISYNNLHAFTDGFWKPMIHLRYLDISFNNIASLGANNLAYLQQLTTLRANNNSLASPSLEELPGSLTELSVGHNMITTIPNHLPLLRRLDIEYNGISKIDINQTSNHRMESLNISGNALTDFPRGAFEKIVTLDVSNNKLSSIPESFGEENFPKLKTLIISGNPIRELKFPRVLRLRLLIANSLKYLKRIGEGAFTKLRGLSSEECIDIVIAHSMELNFIHEKAFDGMSICFLDLSNNKFTHISSDVIQSKEGLKMTNGVNVQGNPFHCDCTLQWMLNDLVPRLYSTHSELLNDLRCATPPELENKRMVHWYKWQEQVFCDDTPILLSKMTAVKSAGMSSKSTNSIRIESSTGMLAVLIGAIVVLSILVTIGIALAQKVATRRTRQNRRF